jgi:hypothetical protein
VYVLKQNYESEKLCNRRKMFALTEHRLFSSGVGTTSIVGPA